MHMHHQALQPDPRSLPCACTALRKASRVVGRLYDNALAGAGVTANQLAILRALGRSGPQPLSRLADSMVMDRTSLYRALAPMARDGWVSIEGAGRGRSRVAALTGEGRRVMDAAADRWEAAQAHFVGAFGADEWLALSTMLQAVIAMPAAAAGAAAARRSEP